jgi:1,4-dihydroxy-6-naphthoate synthase
VNLQRQLTLGFSPCPNDTLIFNALVHGLVSDPSMQFAERLEDVETLNLLVLEGALDISKVSFHLYALVRDRYRLLRSGGALGYGCGPLVVARDAGSMQELRGKRIAVPGRHTTAALLLRLFDHLLDNLVFLPFHEIMPAVHRGEVAAGVIIHESRFTYRDHGLVSLLDLGAWWERETGSPIPLGCIVAKRSLGDETVAAAERLIRASVLRGLERPEEARPYIRTYSQEMSDEVCAAHIRLYVNDFSIDVGPDGMKAVDQLVSRAEAAGIIPCSCPTGR